MNYCIINKLICPGKSKGGDRLEQKGIYKIRRNLVGSRDYTRRYRSKKPKERIRCHPLGSS